ncbi:hypothetical protein C8F01DRAFT_1260608 [Mycena amicta]|nr:hypothetical protein C8F01DRAFT_1262253 [Mycena amicta]KAJ7053634.1 hypothetical protein C8F01DRAFT_1260608 [Mycena amicta]
MQFTLLACLSAFVQVGFQVVAAATVFTSEATVVDYGGAVGACNTPIQDTDLAVALPSSQFAASLCGEKMAITLTGTTKVVNAVIVDICIACVSPRDIGLTQAAFEALAPLSEGTIDVTYSL